MGGVPRRAGKGGKGALWVGSPGGLGGGETGRYV